MNTLRKILRPCDGACPELVGWTAKFLRTVLFGLALMQGKDLSAFIDSAEYHRIISEGQRQLCSVIDNNDCAIVHGDYSKMQFVVMVDGGEDYSLGYAMNGNDPHPATTSPIKDSINHWLQGIYQEYHLELYLIFINSLDVMVNAPLPDSATARDLFLTKLYDDKTTLHDMQDLHVSISTGIVNSIITPKNRDCIIYSQASYKGAFHGNGLISEWKYSKFFRHSAQESTFPHLQELYADFFRRYESDPLRNAEDALTACEAIVNDFRETLHGQLVRSYIQQQYHPDNLKLILVQLRYPQDYVDLTIQERRHILSVFAGYPMSADFLGSIGEERYSIRTIVQTPQNQVEDLLLVLSQTNYLNDDPQYHGVISNTVLIYMLMYRIDDGFWNEDQHYTQFVKAITDLMTSNNAVMANHLPVSDAEWMNRKIDWGGEMQGGLERIGYKDFDVELHGDGKIVVQSRIVSGWTSNLSSNINSSGVHPYTVAWTTNPVYELNPFDLVFFTNRSNVSMLEEFGAHRNSVKVAPAIFLKYADDKQFGQDVYNAFTNTLAVGGSAAAIMMTGGAVITAIEAADIATAVYEASQFIGVIGQIGADVSNNPTFQNIALTYNSIIGLWGVGELLASSSTMPAELLTRAKAGTIHPASETAITEFRARYSQIESHLDELDPANRSRLERMEEYLGEGYFPNPANLEVGELVAGRAIQRIKTGSNGKVAILGRKMDGHVLAVAEELRNQGYNVEVFNVIDQANNTFVIDGISRTWQQIAEDFSNLNGQYATDANGWILDSDLPNTMMYKADALWTDKIIQENYTIIDMGYPPNSTLGPSLFYNMELSKVHF